MRDDLPFIEHGIESNVPCREGLGDFRGTFAAADFLVVSEREINGAFGTEAPRYQGFYCLVQGHQRGLVVERTATPNEPIHHCATERRLLPFVRRYGIHRYDILVRHQQDGFYQRRVRA
jgi:hypothetical protein